MARRKSPELPQRAELTVSQMRKAIPRFENLIERLEKFDPNEVDDRNDIRISELETAIQTAVEKTYSAGTTQYNSCTSAASIDRAGFNMMGPTPIHEVREGLQNGKDEAIVLLRAAINDLREDIADGESSTEVTPKRQGQTAHIKNIFVVHGHDDAAKHEVARFITKAGLNPIILHEQANMGRTVIEKLEKNSDVRFAVVLLTPDDLGRAKDNKELNPRARQNVIAELFYFIGLLGRDRVCALKKGELQIPSDIGGVVYIPMDAPGAWKTALLRECTAAGYDVEWKKALG